MGDPNPLPVVTVRELSRSPGRVLARVARGERFLVCRHGRPIATLQPLSGVVVQFEGREYDTKGSPLGDAAAETAKLSDLQQTMLSDCIEVDRIVLARLSSSQWPGQGEAIEDLIQRGLVRRTFRGLTLTGRGMILHEHLAAERGLPPAPRFRWDPTDRDFGQNPRRRMEERRSRRSS